MDDEENKEILNRPSDELPSRPLTRRELDKEFEERFNKIDEELRGGLNFIRKHPKSVTFFGSARFSEENPYYEKAREIGRRIVEAGFDVMTGGGPGIMEAANRGAREGDGSQHSVGFTIQLPAEQVVNPYVDDSVGFYYFFTRKLALTFSAEAYIFFPGGFGTLDEFFEILTLVQTRKIEHVPIILFGENYWRRLDSFFKDVLEDEFKTISGADRKLFTITDDIDMVLEIVKSSPLRDE